MAAPMARSNAEIEAGFAAKLHRLTGIETGGAEQPRLGLAVSGGPDSLALLLIAHTQFPGAFRVATIDHRLRPEAAEEAAYVARICKERGVDHAILSPEQPITGNLQSAARDVRYALLAQWADDNGLDWIATAHHADDQLETLLMRIARGSGIAGLSGVRETNGRIIRPLLGVTKKELVAYCAAHGVVPCDDPSNSNTDFDRVQFRNWLASAPSTLDARRTARTVAALSGAHMALEWAAAQIANDRLVRPGDGKVRLDPQGLPSEFVRRLLILALQAVDPAIDPRGSTTDRALAALAAGETLTIGNILCRGGPIWHFQPAPERRQNH